MTGFWWMVGAVLLATALRGQVALQQGRVNELYQAQCASCHGVKGEGGLGGSFLDDEWVHGQGDLFAGGLSAQQLHRLKLDGLRVVEEEILFRGLGTVRDVANGPDGCLYVVINTGRENGAHLYRLVPASGR